MNKLLSDRAKILDRLSFLLSAHLCSTLCLYSTSTFPFRLCPHFLAHFFSYYSPLALSPRIQFSFSSGKNLGRSRRVVYAKRQRWTGRAGRTDQVKLSKQNERSDRKTPEKTQGKKRKSTFNHCIWLAKTASDLKKAKKETLMLHLKVADALDPKVMWAYQVFIILRCSRAHFISPTRTLVRCLCA